MLGSGLFTPSRHTSTLLFSVKVKPTSCAKVLFVNQVEGGMGAVIAIWVVRGGRYSMHQASKLSHQASK